MMVLITGASGGLGRAMAVEAARFGYDLLLTDLTDASLCQIRQGIERQFGVHVCTRACDLTDAAQREKMFGYIAEAGLEPDMLLNVAGIEYEGGFLSQPCANIARIVRVNVEAALMVMHAALTHRRPGQRLTVINVSSLASQYPMPYKATYAASKRFVLNFSVAARQELKGENVNVMALCPGGLRTTREALLGIASQGIWGDLTTNDLAKVARKAIRLALKGRGVYNPGVVNGLLRYIGYIVPNRAVAGMLCRRWQKARSRWSALQSVRVR